MSGDNIDKLYYSQGNLDNTYKLVSEEILRRTNKDISFNPSYRTNFNKMAQMVYDKCPTNERNLMNVNNRLSEKSITYFHNKIFEKTVNKPTEKQSTQAQRTMIMNSTNATNTTNSQGFTMIKENEDLSNKFNEMIANRDSLGTSAGVRGDGNPNTYLPQPAIPSSQYVSNEKFVKGAREATDTYEAQYLRQADMPKQNNATLQRENIDFTINSFNLSDDLTDSLVGSENADSPLYQNIENLQRMDGVNPMSMLDDYQRQRNAQAQQYASIEKRENITALKTFPVPQNNPNNNIPYDNIQNNNARQTNTTNAKTNTSQIQVDSMKLYNFGNELADNYSERIEERIVNDNNIQMNSSKELNKMQESMVNLQRDTQPKYIEKVHYININSVDRLWEQNSESRYNFKVFFNQNSTFEGAAISQQYKNIISVELVSAILPIDTTINTFDTRIYAGIMKYPYLLLRIDELDNVFKGTNNWTDRAFSTLLFDKVYHTNTLSTDYVSGTTTSIVNSSPTTAFTPEYMRGFMKFNPAYFEKKKFYNNPLASLSRMSISITDPRGNYINSQNDVLSLSNIGFTSTLNVIGNTLEIDASNAFPYVNQSAYKMIKLTSTSTFSNRLFRIGDNVLMKDFTSNISISGSAASNNSTFNTFINRAEGHYIVNLDLESSADGANKSFIQNLYISPPGSYSATSNSVSGYYDNTTIDFTGATFGSLINLDLQTHLLFRIVTRDPDTEKVLKPVNIY